MTRSLRALLENVIDYAGLYPPASLPLEQVIANYERYRESAEGWMLNRLVLPADKLTVRQCWRVTLLVDDEPGPLPLEVETLETKRPGRLSLPTYCEVPIEQVDGAYAKVRTAGLPGEALADFLLAAASRRLPFKATAGLHHAVPGFLNVFAAAVFAWQGADRGELVRVLEEQDASAFRFGEDALEWRDRRASVAEIGRARGKFAHSFGSCSFEEPVADLRALGLLA